MVAVELSHPPDRSIHTIPREPDGSETTELHSLATHYSSKNPPYRQQRTFVPTQQVWPKLGSTWALCWLQGRRYSSEFAHLTYNMMVWIWEDGASGLHTGRYPSGQNPSQRGAVPYQPHASSNSSAHQQKLNSVLAIVSRTERVWESCIVVC